MSKVRPTYRLNLDCLRCIERKLSVSVRREEFEKALVLLPSTASDTWPRLSRRYVGCVGARIRSFAQLDEISFRQGEIWVGFDLRSEPRTEQSMSRWVARSDRMRTQWSFRFVVTGMKFDTKQDTAVPCSPLSPSAPIARCWRSANKLVPESWCRKWSVIVRTVYLARVPPVCWDSGYSTARKLGALCFVYAALVFLLSPGFRARQDREVSAGIVTLSARCSPIVFFSVVTCTRLVLSNISSA